LASLEQGANLSPDVARIYWLVGLEEPTASDDNYVACLNKLGSRRANGKAIASLILLPQTEHGKGDSQPFERACEDDGHEIVAEIRRVVGAKQPNAAVTQAHRLPSLTE
jgi:hypothetical protein